MKNWKYAVSAAPAAPKTAPILLTGDICDCLRRAAALGFDAIEYHTRETTEFDYEKIIATMDETGCRVSMIVTGRLFTEGGYSLTSEDPANEQTAVAGMLHYVDMASKLGAGLVIGWAKGNIRAAADEKTYFDRLTKNLKTVDAAAAEKKVPVVIEVINHYEVDVFTTAAQLAEYLQHGGFKSIYAHLDTFHMQLEEESFTKAIERVGGKLGYFHIADSTRRYPGSGYLDFKEILRALESIGYDGYLALECFPGDDNEDTARKGLQYMKFIQQTIL